MHVESSAIRAIDYDPPRRALRVTFTSGERYEYSDVPGAVHRAFLAAPSKGRFFQVEIRDRYRCQRLPGPKAPASRRARRRDGA